MTTTEEYIKLPKVDIPKSNQRPIGVFCCLFDIDRDNQVLVPKPSPKIYYNLSEYKSHFPTPELVDNMYYYDLPTISKIEEALRH